MKTLLTLALFLLLSIPGNGSDFTRRIHAELNLARTQPRIYARIVEREMAGAEMWENQGAVREAVAFLYAVEPLPPLRASAAISASALAHVLDLGQRGARGHRGSDGSLPWDRMARFGQLGGRSSENIHYGRRGARRIVVALIVDDGVRNRGHRKNIFARNFRYAGVAAGPHARFGAMCVINFADHFSPTGARPIAARLTPFAPAL